MLEHYGISIAEILTLPDIAKCRVLGGAAGLKRIVSNVNVMEVPDILPWIKSGDFILTTGYAIKDDIEAQKSLIPQLARQGAAGLAIKPHRYIEAVPPYMIEAADNLSFPLLELPVEINFSKVISTILAQLVNRQASFLEHSVTVHQQFTDLILNGGQLDQIAEALGDLINAYVYLEDQLNLRQVIYPVDLPKAVTGFFENKDITIDKSRQLGINHYFYHERLSLEGQEADSAALPVIIEGKQYGWVKAVCMERRFSMFELLTLERVCSIVALDILRQYNITQVEIKYKAEFLSQLLTSSDYDEKDFLERGKTFGWDLTAGYATLLLEILPSPKASKSLATGRIQQDFKTQAAFLIDDFCRRKRLKYFLVNNDDGLALFVNSDSIIPHLRLLLNYWKVTIGIGGNYDGIKGIKKSYREAKVALELGKYLYGTGADIYYRNLGVYGLLLKHTRITELKEFVDEILGPLLAYDSNKKGELIRTLQVFLETNWNVKETAEKLYTHYNTVLYRVNKIKELTGIDFNSPDQKLGLVIAMRLSQVINRFSGNI